MTDKTPGHSAYKGYLAYSGGKSLITGRDLPSWEDQNDELRAAWEAAADAVLRRGTDPAGDASSGVRF